MFFSGERESVLSADRLCRLLRELEDRGRGEVRVGLQFGGGGCNVGIVATFRLGVAG